MKTKKLKSGRREWEIDRGRDSERRMLANRQKYHKPISNTKEILAIITRKNREEQGQ